MTTKSIPRIISKQIVVEGKESELPNEGIFTNNNHSLKFDYDGDVGMPSRHHVSICYDADGNTVAGSNILFTDTSAPINVYNDPGVSSGRDPGVGIGFDPTDILPSSPNFPFQLYNIGYYKIEITCYFECAATGLATVNIIVDGGKPFWTARPNVDSTGYGFFSCNITHLNPSKGQVGNPAGLLTVQLSPPVVGTDCTILRGTTINIYRFA